MSGLKAIRRRITSVKNTKQITRAMKLVSAAKLRRAQEAAEGGRSFGRRLGDVLQTVLADLPEGFSHPLLSKREGVQKRCLVVIAGERGLCGAYNGNIVKAVNAELRSSAVPIEMVLVGRRAVSAAKRFGWDVIAAFEGLPEEVSNWPISEIGETIISRFISGKCDEVSLLYTQFESAMTQTVTREALLPFAAVSASPEKAAQLRGKTKYDPMPTAIIGGLLPLLIKTQICQAALESRASEHGARMTAMDSATRNADDLIDRLKLFYNRARQSAITRELIDIVGGAEAQK